MDYPSMGRALLFPEYGRNVQSMVDALLEVEDRDRRTAQAHALVALMRHMSSGGSLGGADYERRLWDHLYIMSGLRLDVDGPYPVPTLEQMQAIGSGAQLSYPDGRSVNHWGRLAPQMLLAIGAMEESELRTVMALETARQMKRNARSAHKSGVTDAEVLEEVRRASGGRLQLTDESALDLGVEVNRVGSRRSGSGGGRSGRGTSLKGGRGG